MTVVSCFTTDTTVIEFYRMMIRFFDSPISDSEDQIPLTLLTSLKAPSMAIIRPPSSA